MSDTAWSQYADRLDAGVLREVEAWADDAVLSRLHREMRTLENLKTFLDRYAEAIVARRLRAMGLRFAMEVPTPAGRHCDFEVELREAGLVYLHVKRVDSDPPEERMLRISSRLRALELVRRAFVVSVHWRPGAMDGEIKQLVDEAAEFLMGAHVGEEHVTRDEVGRVIGGVRVVAPGPGDRVTAMIGLPGGFAELAPRARRLMERAHRQFMPRAENVILISTAGAGDAIEIDTALLGTHVERWDEFPPPGRRVAHGRADDGFWWNGRHPQSHVVGWLPWASSPAGDSAGRGHVWSREGPEPDLAVLRFVEGVVNADSH